MHNRIYGRITFSAFVTIGFAIFSSAILSTPGRAQGILPESIPLSSPDQNSPNIAIPLLHKGTLYWAQIKRPDESAATTTQMSGQAIATNVYRLADVNHLTGTYLYQTNDGGDNEDPKHVTTWLGDSSHKPTRLYAGAGYVKLSPGGTYIAVTDKDGVLRVIDREGRERAILGKANNAIFSPDGTKLAFFKTIPYTVSDAGGIVVIDLVSGQTLATYDPDGAPYIPLAFEDDGATLYFAANSGPAFKNGDLSSQNRVDVYALTLMRNTLLRLVTTGVDKLPYIEYARTEYLSGLHLLALFAEDTMWILNIQTGDIQVFPDVVDIFRVGSSNMLLGRAKTRSTSNQSWNVMAIH